MEEESSAERIALVAVHENPSRETLSSFCEMEINTLRKGLFLLEIIISELLSLVYLDSNRIGSSFSALPISKA